MKGEKDWIIENIRHLIRQKGLKEEYIARKIGILQGEFSKILNGKRKNYTSLVHKIAETLDVSFHELVLSPNTQTATVDYISMEVHKSLIDVCDSRHEANLHTIELLKDNLEKLQNKYNKLKTKLEAAEEALEKVKK